MLALIQQGFVGNGARRQDPYHFTLNRAFTGGRITNLFANGNGFALIDQSREVVFGGMVGHTGHRDRLTITDAAFGQRNIKQFGGAFGVIKEKLVKITHPIEQQHVSMFCFYAQVLLHHGCM